ncbi:MAG: hypothetical protein LBV63_01290 [Candidatus Methanoplasma sp.]|nr:hypothetical protein [Candidatus Methanoplasma sp.]
MTSDDYMKCRTCRFCIHSEDAWVCTLTASPTTNGGTCVRYRPGCCENCTGLKFSGGVPTCTLTGSVVDTLSVCSDYDPCGRRSM